MSEAERIVRVAAKGDGVTESGRHVARAAPGDQVLADGSLQPGPHHAAAPCRHFDRCGGCQLQHLDEPSLAAFVDERVRNAARALAGGEAGAGQIEVAAPYLSPPRSRRRARLHARREGGRILLGFTEAGSHRIVDVAECPVMMPEMFAVLDPLRKLLARRKGRVAADIDLTMADQGVDLAVSGLPLDGLEQTEGLIAFARAQGLARLAWGDDRELGPDILWEPEPVTISLSGVPVPLPIGAFLQPTADGEAVLIEAARTWLAGAPAVADLFAGLGTFAFALARRGSKVLAAEAAQAAHRACAAAAARAQAPVHALHRDLFRNPLRPEELNRFSGILLDPPRAGAREQVRQIAASTVPRVVYVSCNPSSWSRDAATLIESGYRLAELRPVGQFRWSTHVELASLFVREP